MPGTDDNTTSPSLLQAESFGKPQWEQEVVPRLPEGWQEQAKALGAFQRVRKLERASDLLRGVLAYVLETHSFRHLGMWALLIGLADLSEAAWRKRLAKARAWLGWLLMELLAIGVCTTPWLLDKGLRRVLLVDGTHLRCEGKDGQVYRLHTAFDLVAGRLSEVQVTTTHVAEDWSLFEVQEGDLIVSDSANGYESRWLFLLERKADGISRFHPCTLPLGDENGQPLDVLSWLKGRHAPSGRIVERAVWLPGHPQHRWRLIGLRLTAQQAAASRKRKRKKAGQDKRRIQAQTLYLAGWLLVITTLPADTWKAGEVLTLYRGRWHIELFFKRWKQLLDAHRLRCEHPDRAVATVLAWLLAWVLQEEELVAARLHLQEAAALPVEVAQAAAMPEPEQGQQRMVAGLCQS
jgi:DDE family transposase